jgi:hypothetical protein
VRIFGVILCGHFLCMTLIMTMTTNRQNSGRRTPRETFHPARDSANTPAGKHRNIKKM